MTHAIPCWIWGMYSTDRCPQRWMLAHPIATGVSLFLFFCREMEKKYLTTQKWGSIPRYPSHSAMKAAMC